MKNIFNKKFYFFSKFLIILILFFANYSQNIYICAAIEENELMKNIDLSTNQNLVKKEIHSKPEKIHQNTNKMYTFFEIIINKNKKIPSVNFLSMSELPETSNLPNTNNPFSNENEVNLSSLNNINPEVMVTTSNNKKIPSVNFLSMSELPETSNLPNTNNPFYHEVNLSSLNNINPEMMATTSNNNFKYQKFLKYLLLGTINIFFGSVIIFFTTYFI